MGMKELNGLGSRIRKLREKGGITQERLAGLLGVHRPAVSQIEAGKREVASTELKLLSEFFQVSADELLQTERPLAEPKKWMVREPKFGFDKNKFRNLLLYVLSKCGARPNVGKTVIYKLLYFCDFDNYELYEEPLTGANYRKIAHGPAPCEFDKIISDMKAKNEIVEIGVEYHGKLQTKYLPNAEADLSVFSAREKEVIDRVVERLSVMDAARISDYSHEDVPLKSARDKEIINYEFVFYRTPAYSLRVYPEE
jgi:transcriptional regulator with XRE-family HTH domain